MPVPVISPVQSIIGYLQWQAFGFQPVATNNPTSWTCSPIAPGLYFDPVTGLISGAASLPGTYNFEMTATNGTGTSAPQQFCMGIEASGFLPPANVIDIVVDITSKKVSLAGTGIDAGAAPSQAPSSLFMVKYGDDLLMNVRFKKGGVAYAPSMSALKFAMKEYEPERVLVQSDGSFLVQSLGTGESSFLLYSLVKTNALKSALTNYENDQATQFPALCEIEWVEYNLVNGSTLGPTTRRTTTETFTVMVPRDIIPNT